MKKAKRKIEMLNVLSSGKFTSSACPNKHGMNFCRAIRYSNICCHLLELLKWNKL